VDQILDPEKNQERNRLLSLIPALAQDSIQLRNQRLTLALALGPDSIQLRNQRLTLALDLGPEKNYEKTGQQKMTELDEKKERCYQYVKDNFSVNYERDTTILSSTCRQLAFGLGGIVVTKLNIEHVPYSFCTITIILLLLFFFISDAAQYLNQSNSYKKLADDYNRAIKNNCITSITQLEEKDGMGIAVIFFF
jgi:hypothetical protein